MSSQASTAAAGSVPHYDLYIDGASVPAASGRTFESINPANGQVIATVAEGDKADIDRAVVAARNCYENVWSQIPVGERGRLLLRVAQRIQDRMSELAHLETLDMGGPTMWTAGTAMQAVEVFEYWAGMATKIQGEVNPSMLPGESLNYTLREPLGVVGGIIPWNGPLIMAAWKTAPAIACGNTVVLKPAELTPITALELAKCFAEAGAPPGLFNVVPGFGPTAGAALAAPTVVRAQDTLDSLKILVGFPAGGSADVVSRQVADRLVPAYVRSALVDNRPGAAGRIAIDVLKTSPPDGRTLLLTPASTVTVYADIVPAYVLLSSQGIR